MATSSIGVPIVLNDEMADKIFAAMDRPAKKIEVENEKIRFTKPKKTKELIEGIKKCYGLK